MALVSEVGGPILGRTGEAAACLCAGEKERGGKGKQDGGQRLFMAALWHCREEKGQGVRGRHRVEDRNGEERGGGEHGGG
jgi:hypothetical protein